MRHGLDVDRRAAAALTGAQLVDHPVLGDLEQPRRELAAAVEPRQRLVDAQEDLLAQVLGQGPVATQDARDVVVQRRLVLAGRSGRTHARRRAGQVGEQQGRVAEGQVVNSLVTRARASMTNSLQRTTRSR